MVFLYVSILINGIPADCAKFEKANVGQYQISTLFPSSHFKKHYVTLPYVSIFDFTTTGTMLQVLLPSGFKTLQSMDDSRDDRRLHSQKRIFVAQTAGHFWDTLLYILATL